MGNISAMMTQVYGIDVNGIMALSNQKETQGFSSISTGIKTLSTNLLSSTKSLGIGGIKLKPLNYFHARIHSSPFELMKSYGRWDTIKNVNLYTLNSLYKGVGSSLNLTA